MADAPGSPPTGLRAWNDPAVLAVAVMAFASGFGQFGAVAALGDVAKHFGRVVPSNSIASQAGLSFTELGVALAIFRVASLGGLPLTGLADRWGRRPVLVRTCALGLVCTMLAALSPGFWWFVVIFALGRPLLSATNAVAQVSAAEETSSRDRSTAVALIAAGYGVGSGLTAVIAGAADSTLGFRGVFALAVVPLAVVLLIRRYIVEPARFSRATPTERAVPVLGAVGPRYRRRLLVVTSLAFAVAVVTGPANSFLFVYARNLLHMSGDQTALMVVAASVFGLSGLLLGRGFADRVGRRPTAAVAMAAMATTGIVAYSGSRWALVVGYETAVLGRVDLRSRRRGARQ